MESHIGGFVEQIFAHHVTGWAADLDNTSDITVRLNSEGRILSRTLPALFREDVKTAFKIDHLSGFYLSWENIRELLQNGAFIEAGTDDRGYTRLETVEGAFEVPAKGYQDFLGDEAGTSKSQAKLEALQLSFLDHLKSRQIRILDIGCNEGYFCDAIARRFDTSYVLGIDNDLDYVERARARFPQFDFRHQSWWQVEESSFDIILFLSAVHYENDQTGFFRFLSRKLTPGGVLILECGIADSLMVHPEEKWIVAHRADGFFRYPTYRYLVNGLLAPFSVKYIEKSVSQAGDPVSRHVLHCWSKRQNVILLSGKSGRGKTELARSLGQTPDVQTIYTDALIVRLLTDGYLESSALAARLRRIFEWPVSIELVQRFLHDNDLVEEYMELLVMTIDQHCATVVIDGAFLDYPVVVDSLTRRLSSEARSWRMF